MNFAPILAALMIGLAPVAAGAQPAGTAPAPVPVAGVEVRLETSAGPIVIAVDTARAPITAANFLRYVDEKKLDGTGFYRAMRVGDGLGLVQAGTRNEPKRTLPGIEHEPTSRTGILHVDGTVSMARHAPGTAAGDFFITLGALPSLDAQPDQPGDNLGFAAFGRVVSGMDVVKRIWEAPISDTEGEGAMRGQMIAEPVKILSAKRVQKPAG